MISENKRKRYLILLVICLSVVLSLLSFRVLNAAFGKAPDEPSSAHFDYFIYEGADSFYINHPLPGKEAFYNPILPGWNSDPSICQRGNDYFLVTSSFVYFPGVPLFHSTDLMNWKQIGFVLDRPSQLKLEGQRTSEGIFAPAISYNPANKTFYMITTNVGAGNFFVKTTDPFDSWSDPVWLPEVHGIDPSFFFDDNGKAYILNNDEPEGPARYQGHRAIRIREFDTEQEKVVGEEHILVDGGVRPEENPIWIEGPHMYKIGNTYYLMSAEGGTGPGHSEVILKGKSPMGKFVPWEKNPILTQRHLDPKRENPVTCAGHADLVTDRDGNWWSVFLACRPIGKGFENLGRETFLMPVRWSSDSFPYMTQGDELIPLIVPMEGIEQATDVTYGNFSKRYDFDSSALGVDWFTLRSAGDSLISLEEKRGYLTLACSPISASDRKTPAFVARRIQHHRFSCETRVSFKPGQPGETAGLLLYKDEGHQYFLALEEQNNEMMVGLYKISERGYELLASNSVGRSTTVKLKIESSGEHFNFYYAGRDSLCSELIGDVDAYYLSTANSFGFTGTTIALYATNTAKIETRYE